MKKEAEAFLAKYNPDGVVPVPIDEIAEFDLGLGIRPLGDLRRKYGRRGMAFSKRKLIVIDAHEMDNDLHGYRFTLAHEIGHLMLHEDFIDSLNDLDEASLLADLANVGAHQAGTMEREASGFARRILVPTDELIIKVAEMRTQILAKVNLDITDLKEESHHSLSQTLSRAFDVAPEVIRRRLVEEGLP